MAGYSSTPTVKKLGIGPGSRVVVIGSPADYETIVGELPDGATQSSRVTSSVDVVHLFTRSADDLATRLARLRNSIRDDAAVWISWPKKASKTATDITEDRIRDIALPMGFVDVKVCAVDEVWSGLKLVIRKELRGK
jgi:hypothetical protein